MHLLHYLHLLKLLKEKDKMKIVRKHLKLNRELMYEYLRINTELFNQEKITCLNNEIRSIYDDNESEFNEIVLNISDNNMKLRVFLMDIYVNGFKNISFVLRQNRNIKDEKNLSELDKQYLNMEHGIRTICRGIEAYLFVNYKIKLSEIDYNKYNISQKYFGSFELRKPTESNATKKEPQQEKEISKEQLTLRKIALKYIYENIHINKQNNNSIAKEYEHKSGHKLQQHYNYYSSLTNRTANEETDKKLENKIKLINSVIPLLSIENQIKPKEEVSILEAKLTNDKY